VRYAFIIGLIILSLVTKAQSDTTMYLKEVKVYGLPLSRYAPGGKIQHISGKDQSTTLTDMLGSESPLYFKTYGNGQLATVAFRGTSASHTAVLWNGINVNSPTLGQTDFSLWPSFLLDEVSLQYGAGSALYGTDALGGSVLLNQSLPQFKKQKKILFRQEAGSFGHWLSGIQAAYGNERIELRTKVFYRALENNFSYTSPKVGFKKKQHDASVESYGLDQQLHWKISEQQTVSAEGMYTYNFREIQQPVTNNDPGEVIKDRNTRFSLSYTNDFRKGGSLYATVGFIQNDQVYNRNSTTRSDQLTALVQYDQDVGKRSSLRIGSNWTKYFSKSNGFAGRLTEDRYDAFLSFRHRVKSWWLSSLNLREAAYAGQLAPFAPSWGNELTAVAKQDWKILFKTQLARAYRVPTLNDRYWVPGGNLDLKSETGINAEIGAEVRLRKKRNDLSFELNHHRLWVDQWIIWLPNLNGLWTPSNLSTVHVRGIEASLNETFRNEQFILKMGASYAYTRSINQQGLNETDIITVGKQLPYVPIHSGNAFAKIEKKLWSLEIQTNYTGLRYTTLDNEDYQALKAYTLLSTSVGKRFVFLRSEMHLRFAANNLFNTYYENIENRAMPGINFTTALTIKF
jgi:vitamin B12 transporter